jgi:hypothetical protein
MLIIMEPKGEREEMNRTTTKLPGFTAEASLFTSSGNYGSEGRYKQYAIEKMVIPAMEEEIESCRCPCCQERTDLSGNKVLVCC